ncbi:DNA polymerase III subunit gamma/tau [Chlamydiales bacterium SCGC AB-751-O23]|jgi:DNA polymerase III subunit gamma/tau|nr:DNA polymerase III subunit gamma/tau [Chlamydiales bacterium SCGC AB-751-O23]
MSKEYLTIPRKFRPQQFKDIVGQRVIVETLKNSLALNCTSHAYLFCGSKGTGKTSTARVFAKALLCPSKDSSEEPCNQCTFCQEITLGNSLNVIEIDGASNRGIDDIRKINENTSYPPEKGTFRIFIIDEVHMLTKEAFNALLKTLEEPPPHIKFIFATTEAHKIPSTILSRCQKFSFSRHKQDSIEKKLQLVAKELSIKISKEVLEYIASFSDGSLRDAESLLDQISAFSKGDITLEHVQELLGLPESKLIFELEQALREQNIKNLLEISHSIFNKGKDYKLILDALIEHFRKIVHFHVLGSDNHLILSSEKEAYQKITQHYSLSQCQHIIDLLIQCHLSLQQPNYARIYFENSLFKITTFLHSISLEETVEKLFALESKLSSSDNAPLSLPPQQPAPPISKQKPTPPSSPPSATKEEIDDEWGSLHTKKSQEKKSTDKPLSKVKKETSKSAPSDQTLSLTQKENTKIDTILQFSGVELEGLVKKNKIKINYEES